MNINITDMKAGRTTAGNPKVNFVVWFCDRNPDGTLEPMYGHEGWTLLKRRRKLDDRGAALTTLRLPQVPWVKWGDRFTGRYLTVNQINEDLLDRIHQHVATLPWVRRWMGLPTLESKKETAEVPEVVDGGDFDSRKAVV